MSASCRKNIKNKKMEENKPIVINLAVILKTIYKDRKQLIIFGIVGAVFGLIVAFSIPRIYKSTVVLAPEETSNGFMGSVSSLASMVGMDMKLGKTGDAIYPEIYPDVMGSTDFLVGLFSVPVTTKDKSYSADYATYLNKKTKSPWWDYPKTLLLQAIKKVKGGGGAPYTPGKKVDPFQLSRNEYELMLGISGNISCSVDKKTNVITITVTDQDPYIAACMADTVTSRLQHLITDYRTKKSREDVKYLNGILAKALENYKTSQDSYAAYTEGHRNAKLEYVNQTQAKLKSEMEMAENIYTTVSEQLELAKAKVQENTPAFITIQSASVPVKHSNTPKIIILALFFIIGIMVRGAFVIYKNHDKFFVRQ